MEIIKAANNREKGFTCSKYLDNLLAYEKELVYYKTLDSIKLLEIGVSGGGSLWMWKKYFPNATIHGIDNNQFPSAGDCRKWGDVNQNVFVHIGSQNDTNFLTSINEEHGPFDIIIDDGSHIMEHQQKSLFHLWPLLKDKGVYVIEDLHTSYFTLHNGKIIGELENTSCKSSTLSLLQSLPDKLHKQYLPNCKDKDNIFYNTLNSVNFYDSICFLSKNINRIPTKKINCSDDFRKEYLEKNKD